VRPGNLFRGSFKDQAVDALHHDPGPGKAVVVSAVYFGETGEAD